MSTTAVNMTALNPRTLPYEILQTACEVYAGKTGFSQEQMQAFFYEAIMKWRQSFYKVEQDEPMWVKIFGAVSMSGLDLRRQHEFSSRAEALEYWLSQLPLAEQKELLLDLCRKADFPMWKKPSQQQRNRLAVLLKGFIIDERVSLALQTLDSHYISQLWVKALDRCASDPENAITLARTLLESTCKHILDKRGRAYDDKADLQTLYTLAANELRIAPNLQTAPIFQRIFTGFQTVIVGLGSLRNNLGDAHGRGSEYVKPTPRHAELAVNLAGAAALFLIQELEAN